MRKICLSWLCLLVLSMHLHAQGDFSLLFQRREWAMNEEIKDIFTRDLNQDGLKDLIIQVKSGDRMPLRIFIQDSSGFPQEPDQALELDDQAILFDMADLIGEYPGEEILYLTRDSLWYYYLERERYREKPKKLADLSSILQSTSPECPIRGKLILDPDDGEPPFLFVPGPDQGILFHFTDGKVMSRQEIRLKPAYITSTKYRSSDEHTGLEFLSQLISVSVPAIYLQDFNGDGRKDFIAVYKDKIKMFERLVGSRFSPEPDFAIDLEVLSDEEKRMAIRPVFKVDVVDIDADGIADILVTKNTIKTTTGITKIYIHMNTNGEIKKTPDQIMVLDNSIGYPEIVDIDGDKHKDLIITELKFGLMQILKILITKKANYKECIYLRASGKYPRFPDFKLKSSAEFDFENPESTKGQFIYLDGDFNGDGIKDLFRCNSSDDELLIFRGSKTEKDIYNDKPDFKTKETTLALEFIIEDLNGDKISDIIFDFRRTKKKNLVVYLSK